MNVSRLAQQGCAASFEALVRRHQTPLLQFLMQHSPGRATAEDTAQETFLRAWRRLDRYDPARSFRAWLLTIARRLAINRARRRPVVPLPDNEPEPTTSQLGPDEAAASAEERQSLWRLARATLNEAEVSGLWLHYVERMPLAEIAPVLRRREGAVRTLICRAREELAALEGAAANRQHRVVPHQP